MRRNMGTADRAIRALVALGIAALYLTGTISGMWAVILGIVAVAFAVTSAAGSCPAYFPFGFSTCRSETQGKTG